jgi:hypothetical protein
MNKRVLTIVAKFFGWDDLRHVPRGWQYHIDGGEGFKTENDLLALLKAGLTKKGYSWTCQHGDYEGCDRQFVFTIDISCSEGIKGYGKTELAAVMEAISELVEGEKK